MRFDVALCIGMILVGCGVNVIFLEMIISRDAASGNLITLAQFLFVSSQGLLENLSVSSKTLLSLRPRSIPLWFHLAVTAMFFAVSVLNNLALKYSIAMPLHMVFRASSLSASLLLGYLVFNKNYGREKVIGVINVSLGILATILADAREKTIKSSSQCCSNDGMSGEGSCEEGRQGADDFQTWLFGLLLLTIALFGSAALGHIQEWGYATYGKASGEMKFYSHVLALPYFYVLAKDSIQEKVVAWSQSESLRDALAGWGMQPNALAPETILDVPLLWILLLGNVISQLVCITAVYKLTAISSTLTCTMTITIRKFLSIIVSVVYFQNPFSPLHWAGTALVFVGVMQYSGLLKLPQFSLAHQKTD